MCCREHERIFTPPDYHKELVEDPAVLCTSMKGGVIGRGRSAQGRLAHVGERETEERGGFMPARMRWGLTRKAGGQQPRLRSAPEVAARHYMQQFAPVQLSSY
jgi:hypothetical protein